MPIHTVAGIVQIAVGWLLPLGDVWKRTKSANKPKIDRRGACSALIDDLRLFFRDGGLVLLLLGRRGTQTLLLLLDVVFVLRLRDCVSGSSHDGYARVSTIRVEMFLVLSLFGNRGDA